MAIQRLPVEPHHGPRDSQTHAEGIPARQPSESLLAELPFSLIDLAHRFDGPDVKALALTGSYARGTHGIFSDLDLLRYIDTPPAHPPRETHLVDGRLISLCNIPLPIAEECFIRPELIVVSLAGLRTARALIDRGGYFAHLQARARAFVWDAAVQRRADVWSSRQMAHLSEAAHKGLDGVRGGGVGRLLNGRNECAWGAVRVILVQRGVLMESDNSFYEAAIGAVGRQSRWAQQLRIALGIEDERGLGPSLIEQVIGGLRLYAETAKLLGEVIQPADRAVVRQTVELIEGVLG
jgi:hypothetical protein